MPASEAVLIKTAAAHELDDDDTDIDVMRTA
jgi:hypothetical protein